MVWFTLLFAAGAAVQAYNSVRRREWRECAAVVLLVAAGAALAILHDRRVLQFVNPLVVLEKWFQPLTMRLYDLM